MTSAEGDPRGERPLSADVSGAADASVTRHAALPPRGTEHGPLAAKLAATNPDQSSAVTPPPDKADSETCPGRRTVPLPPAAADSAGQSACSVRLGDRTSVFLHAVPASVEVEALQELAGLTVLHLDTDFEMIAEVTAQPIERLVMPTG